MKGLIGYGMGSKESVVYSLLELRHTFSYYYGILGALCKGWAQSRTPRDDKFWVDP